MFKGLYQMNTRCNGGRRVDRDRVVAHEVQLDMNGRAGQSGWRKSSWGTRYWYDALALFFLAAAVRFIGLDHTPLHDELYHVLAAQSWLENGSFAIDEGSYTRSRFFTVLVAGFFYLFGDSLLAARLPSFIAGSLLVPVVYVWTRWSIGRSAALLAGLLLVFSPLMIHISQYARFYALQGLLIASATFIFYYLLHHNFRRHTTLMRTALLGFVGFALLLANHLQITTMIAVAGIGLWFFVFVLYQLMRAPKASRKPWIVLLAGFAGLGLVAVAALFNGTAEFYWQSLNNTPHWGKSAEGSLNIRFYHYWLLEEYPALWSLFPVLALLGMAKKPAPVLFCLSIFVVAFAFHSIAGFKAQRYFSYLMPFLFIIWAAGGSVLLPFLGQQVKKILEGEWAPLKRFMPPALQYGVFISTALIFFLLSTPAFPLVARMLTRADASWPENALYRGAADWQAAANALQGKIGREDLLITTSGVMARYYLGRYDVELNESNMLEVDSGKEFSRDYRTGHALISSGQSLKKLMQCYPRGFLVAEERRFLRAPRIVPPQTVILVKQTMTQMKMPRDSKMLAYMWENDEAKLTDECRRLIHRRE